MELNWSERLIKSFLVPYLRFTSGHKMVCTEGGFADVLASNSKEIVEYEIKISLADFKGDFKKEKHLKYKIKQPSAKGGILPNKFYYVMPSKIYQEAKSKGVLENIPNKNYGIISLQAVRFNGKEQIEAFVEKNAYSFIKGKDKLTELFITNRMGSELARFWLKDYHRNIIKEMKIPERKFLNKGEKNV